MVLGITKLFAIIIISLSFVTIDGSTEVKLIEAFDFFWSKEWKSVRDACDQPPGNFLRRLTLAIDDSPDCQITFVDWTFFNASNRLASLPKDFDKVCTHKTIKRAAKCWLNIMQYMETCYTDKMSVDRMIFELFHNFLNSLCAKKGISLFAILRPSTSLRCPEESNSRSYPKTENHEQLYNQCLASKERWLCRYITADISNELCGLYIVSDGLLGTIFSCKQKYNIQNRPRRKNHRN